jgi:hypothetical protein
LSMAIHVPAVVDMVALSTTSEQRKVRESYATRLGSNGETSRSKGVCRPAPG